MAVIKAVNSKASIGNAINYVTKKEKTEEKLITGIDCDPKHAIEQMKMTKQMWEKTEGRQYKHFVQSFAPGEKITPKQAHEIARDLFKDRYKGYEILIATHKDKDHIHSHIIVNSVSYENGYKLQQSKEEYKQIRMDSDDLCRKHGLSVTEKGKTFEGKERKDISSYDKDKYQYLLKAEKGKVKSYVYDTAVDVLMSKQVAKSKEEFIDKMAKKGYETDWKDNHKYITFTNQEGQKVRNFNIEKTFNIKLSKEELEKHFEEKSKGKEQIKTAPEPQKESKKNIIPEEKENIEKEIPKPISMEEKKAKRMHNLKILYLKTDSEIQSYKELKEQIQREKLQLDNTAEKIIDRTNTIVSYNSQIKELTEKKQGLGLFKGKDKKQLEEQIKSLESAMENMKRNLYLEFNITPGQAADKINEITNRRKEVAVKMPPSESLEQLNRQLSIIELEYKTEKLMIEESPEKQHIEELLKQRRSMSSSMHDTMKVAKMESKLNHITQLDLKLIVQHNPHNVQLAQIAQNMQQQLSLAKGISKGFTIKR